MPRPASTARRFFAPEVVQTSAMDCGPASLKCLLEGYGIRVSYGRLREACQTDVDGTSIDTIEDVANQLGLRAEQIMVPPDHLCLAEARALPALAVVRLPNGNTHFAVVWRAVGGLVQLMDPATGRRWATRRALLDELYIHTMPVGAADWRQWAGTEDFLSPLRQRLAQLGLGRADIRDLVSEAVADPGWRSLACLDAATRTVDAVVRARGISSGRQARAVLRTLMEAAANTAEPSSSPIPAGHWFVRAAPEDGSGEEKLLLRGAVLLRALGPRSGGRVLADGEQGDAEARIPLSPELVRALGEPRRRPIRELLDLLGSSALRRLWVIAAALLIAAAGVALEALVFRALLDVGAMLELPRQRLGAGAVLLAILVCLLLLELPITRGLLLVGRELEGRLRVAFLTKIPRLQDRYLQSRLTSDMAERCHSVHALRGAPNLAARVLRVAFGLALTTAGIVWLDPITAPVAMLAAVASVGLPLAVSPLLTEQELRSRTHAGALSRFYLDALLGLVAVRSHGAERVVRREHESLLAEWARAGMRFARTATLVDGALGVLGFGLAAWLIFDHVGRGSGGAVLLFVYWTLQLPGLGQQLAALLRQYPLQSNLAQRLLEPLGAEETEYSAPQAPPRLDADASPLASLRALEAQEVRLRARASPAGRLDADPGAELTGRCTEQAAGLPADGAHAPVPAAASLGAAIVLEGVAVRAAGHTILEGVNLDVRPGEHVAIVGASGAGKSTLVGLLLGWHKPADGSLCVDGAPLHAESLAELRRVTAWLDPSVHLWNRSLYSNLVYGAGSLGAARVGPGLEQADLLELLERLPAGLSTPLGEAGALVSGGEGQRVRLCRALLRPDARLAILDEPFRGLDRPKRRELLQRARALWRSATLLCITHDVGETASFDRVVVIDAGRVVEDGSPKVLATTPGSQYTRLLTADAAMRHDLWASAQWRRLRMERGSLVEGEADA